MIGDMLSDWFVYCTLRLDRLNFVGYLGTQKAGSVETYRPGKRKELEACLNGFVKILFDWIIRGHGYPGDLETWKLQRFCYPRNLRTLRLEGGLEYLETIEGHCNTCRVLTLETWIPAGLQEDLNTQESRDVKTHFFWQTFSIRREFVIPKSFSIFQNFCNFCED